MRHFCKIWYATCKNTRKGVQRQGLLLRTLAKQHIDQIYLSFGMNDFALVTQLVETAGLICSIFIGFTIYFCLHSYFLLAEVGITCKYFEHLSDHKK